MRVICNEKTSRKCRSYRRKVLADSLGTREQARMFLKDTVDKFLAEDCERYLWSRSADRYIISEPFYPLRYELYLEETPSQSS